MASKKIPILLLLFAVGSGLLTGCEKPTVEAVTIQMPSKQEIPESAWQKLSTKKIYFGHQSVGGNLIDGVSQILPKEPGLKLNIVKTDDPGKFTGPFWVFFVFGENGDPSSKISAIKANLQKWIG